MNTVNLIEVPPTDLNFWDRTHTFDVYIKNFFRKGINKRFDKFVRYEESKKYYNYQELLGFYVKHIWLTKEYITNNKKFKYPLSLSWNKTKQLWNVHPGGHRSTVIYYFPTNTTLGITMDDTESAIKTFSNIIEMQDYFNTTEININNNSIFIDNNPQYAAINNIIKKTKDFFKTTEIRANFDLQEFGYDKKIITNKKHVVDVKIDNSTNNIQAIRAFLLMPSFKLYNDYGVKIERT
jgi:hypothetical protein